MSFVLEERRGTEKQAKLEPRYFICALAKQPCVAGERIRRRPRFVTAGFTPSSLASRFCPDAK